MAEPLHLASNRDGSAAYAPDQQDALPLPAVFHTSLETLQAFSLKAARVAAHWRRARLGRLAAGGAVKA